jgi:hypothetical protein
MVDTLPSYGMTENDEEVELGLPWVTNWGGAIHGHMMGHRWGFLMGMGTWPDGGTDTLGMGLDYPPCWHGSLAVLYLP